jgi:hypothetical protein
MKESPLITPSFDREVQVVVDPQKYIGGAGEIEMKENLNKPLCGL